MSTRKQQAAEEAAGCESNATVQASSNVFAYWSRGVTARRLAAERYHDPVRAGWIERLSAAAGINLQLGEIP